MSIKNGPLNPSTLLRKPLFPRIFLRRTWSVLATAALVIMETTAMSLWYQALFVPAEISWGGIFALMLGILSASLLLPEVLQRIHWNRFARLAVFLGWIIAAALASLKIIYYPHISMTILQMLALPVQYILLADVSPASFYHLLVIILLVWRGVSLSNRPLSLSGVQGSFQLWLILMLFYGMLFAPLYPAAAIIGLYLYLFCGLVSMSAVRVAGLSEWRGGRTPRFGPGWLASILLSALALVGLSIFVSWLAGGKVIQIFAFVLASVLAILAALLMVILTPLFALLARYIPDLAELVRQFFARLMSMGVSDRIARMLEGFYVVLQQLVPYVMAFRSLFLGGSLLLLVLIILLALYVRKKRVRPVFEETDSGMVTSTGDNPLQKLFDQLLRRARSLRGRSAAQYLAAARVRYIYRQLMALSKKMGAERPASATPLEFLPLMNGVLPGEDAGLDLITQAYLKVRYGEYPESLQEVERVETAWNNIRQKAPKNKR